MLSLFAIRNFRLALAGVVLLTGAQWIQNAALGWIVYDLSNSGTMLGITNGVRGIMNFGLSPIAGLACDRIGSTKVAIFSQAALALLCFILVFLISSGYLAAWHLILFSAAVGAAAAFALPSRRILLFEAVPRELAPNSVAIGNVGYYLARTVGPTISALLIVSLGVATNFFVQGAAFTAALIVSLMMVASIRKPAGRGVRSALRSMKDGYLFAFLNKRFRALLILSFVSPLLLIPIHYAILPIYAKDIFTGGASSLGIMLSSFGLGGFVGAGLGIVLSRIDRGGIVCATALLIYGGSQALFGLVGWLTGDLWYSAGLLFLAGVAEAVYLASNQTMLQLAAPEELRGQLTSLMQINQGLVPIGATLAGILADIVDAPIVVIGFSLCAFVTALVMLTASEIRRLRYSEMTAAMARH